MFLVGDAHLKCSSVFGHFINVYKVLEVMFFVVTWSLFMTYCLLIILSTLMMLTNGRTYKCLCFLAFVFHCVLQVLKVVSWPCWSSFLHIFKSWCSFYLHYPPTPFVPKCFPFPTPSLRTLQNLDWIFIVCKDMIYNYNVLLVHLHPFLYAWDCALFCALGMVLRFWMMWCPNGKTFQFMFEHTHDISYHNPNLVSIQKCSWMVALRTILRNFLNGKTSQKIF
jgi:hypothetical protein